MPSAAIQDTIGTCARIRSWTAHTVSGLLRKQAEISEKQFASTLSAAVRDNADLHSEGWYSPPPSGIAALFSDADNFGRLSFDTLRKEEYWPRADHQLEAGSAGILYASPIHKASGIIGDFGISVYRGKNRSVQAHFSKCLNVLEDAAELAQVGMEFRELHDLSQRLFKENELHNSRTITWTDKVGTNLGHTIPWSYELPSPEELSIIDGERLSDLRNLISRKRVNVNRLERFKIPGSIAFTLEARLESAVDPTMPNVFYHLIITFQNGNKATLSNFNEVFIALGMDSYIRSRF